jgi:phosphotriesterase-related protein
LSIEKYAPERFIWIHTQAEADFDLHLESGLGNRLLLSHDRGWYDPSQPGGGEAKPFTYLSEVFIPRLRNFGVDEATLKQLTQINPFRAFGR